MSPAALRDCPPAVQRRARALATGGTPGVTLGPDSPLHTVPRARQKDEEHASQCDVVAWARRHVATVPAFRWLYAVPNGAKMTTRMGDRLNREGRNAGHPDLVLPWRAEHGGVWVPGCVIEMKTATGAVRREQRDWIAHYARQFWRVEVCRSAAEARAVLCAYLGVPDPEPMP